MQSGRRRNELQGMPSRARLAVIGSAFVLVAGGALAWTLSEAPPDTSVRSAATNVSTLRAMDDPRGADGIEDGIEEGTQDGELDTVPVAGVDVEPAAEDRAPDEASSTNDPSATVGSDPTVAIESPAAPGVAAAERAPLVADAGAPPVREPGETPPADEPPEPCGLFTCGPGYACCNSSCGICVPDGESCDPTPCTPRIQYPVSALCGQNTCSVGEVCCNPTCGTCVAGGESCDPTPCTPRIQNPVSAMCGQNTCSVGEVCCNPTCGTCVAEGQTCDTTPCAPRIRYPL